MPLITNAEHFLDYLKNRERKNLLTHTIKEKLKKWEKWHKKLNEIHEFFEEKDLFQLQIDIENLLEQEPWPYTYKKEKEEIMLKSELLTI